MSPATCIIPQGLVPPLLATHTCSLLSTAIPRYRLFPVPGTTVKVSVFGSNMLMPPWVPP